MTTPIINPKIQETVPCKWCGEPTPMLGTKECDRCYELRSRIEYDPALAVKIYTTLFGVKYGSVTY